VGEGGRRGGETGQGMGREGRMEGRRGGRGKGDVCIHPSGGIRGAAIYYDERHAE
jgi:hypothetical protein